MPKEGKNLLQMLGMSGKPLIGGAPDGVDATSFQGIMGNPYMRLGMGLMKRGGSGGSFGQNLAGAFGDVSEGQEADEMRAYRKAQMDAMRAQQNAAASQLTQMVGGSPAQAMTPQAMTPPAGAKMPSSFSDPVGGYTGGMSRRPMMRRPPY
jgi:hypothetical protein